MSPLLFKRLSDENLGSRLASGEAAAFDELYRRYAHRLAAYGSHLLGDAASGDDVAQAAMLKAYGALRDGRVPDRMKPWLFRIAHNAALDLVVRRRELSTETLPEQATPEREPFAGVLLEALATLPDRQRRVYVLREVHGLRIDETAAELGLTTAQVEQSLFAARNRLAEQLVFGDRLNCVTVQRLAGGPLDASERRALKTHLRTCGDCRQSMGLRGRALSLFPSGVGFEWLRGLGAGLIGGGGPVAAKVGAVVATATLVGGGTVVVEKSNHERSKPAVLHIVSAAPVAHAQHRSALPAYAATQAVAVSAPVRTRRLVVDEQKTRAGDGESSRPSSDNEHAARQLAEHDGAPADGGALQRDGEHTTTVNTTEGHDSSSSERSGGSSDSQPTETQPADTQPQPTETQPTEAQSPPEGGSTTAPTTTTTTTAPTTTTTTSDIPLPAPTVTIPSGD